MLLPILLAFGSVVCAAQIGSPDRLTHHAMRPDAELHGTVLVGGRPAVGANVQLRSTQTGLVVSQAQTDAGGTFALESLPEGDYILTASIGVQQQQSEISLIGVEPGIQISFPGESAGGGSARGNSVVSAKQMLISGKARHSYDEAQRALAKNDFDRAERKVAEALSSYPQFPEALTLRAALRISRGHIEDAIADLDDAIRIDPNYPFAYFLSGAALNATDRYEDAERAVSQGIRLAPRAWQGHIELGKAMLGVGQPAAALKELDAASGDSLPASFSDIHLLRGMALLRLQRYGESAQELQNYLELQPNAPNAEQIRNIVTQMQANGSSGQQAKDAANQPVSGATGGNR